LKEALKSLNEMTGEWHDYTVLISSLKRFAKRKAKKDIPELKNLITKLEKQNRAERKRIYHLLNEYMAEEKLKPVEHWLN